MTMPTKKTNTKPRRVKAESTWPLATCNNCKEEYRADPSRGQGAHRQRYCSNACANQVRARLQKVKPRGKKEAPDKASLKQGPVSKAAKATKRSRITKLPKTHNELRELRRTFALSQYEFWRRIGVTQSGGSRYEQGRSLPPPVAKLLDAVYIKGVALERLSSDDFAILEFLKTQHPDLYKSLDKATRGVGKRA